MFSGPARRRRWSSIALLALLVSALPLHSAIAQNTRVAQIDIVGATRINRETILGIISTKVGDEVSADRLERDRRAVEALGWFKIVGPPAVSQVPGGARIVFVVTEWPLLNSIEFTGNTVIGTDPITGVVKTQTGQVFNLAQWQADVAAIENLYRNKNYVGQVLDNIDTPEFAETGVLKAQILELKIEAVKVTGLTKSRPYLVTRVLRQKAGELYNTEKMAKDYQELRRLDYFETINSRVDVSQPGMVIITWEFKEKRTGQASVGVGYSPREAIIGRAEVTETNLFGRGQSVSLAGEIGSRVGGPSFELSFNEPWLTPQRTSLGLAFYDKLVYRFSGGLGNISGQTNSLNRYFERRLGGQVSFGRPFGLPITTTFRSDNVQTPNFKKMADFPRQDGQITSVGVRAVRNTRDYVQYPTSGFLNSAHVELGYASLDKTASDNFGTSLYSKLTLDARKYIALEQNPKTREPEREQAAQKIPVLALRLMGGAAANNLPFFEQFFLGGSESLRGYLEDRFWGQYVFLGSAEYRKPLFNRITGVVFVDAGDAWGSLNGYRFNTKKLRKQYSQTSGFSIQPDIGIGLRVATPIGPIRLDYGYGLEGGHANFSIGQSF